MNRRAWVAFAALSVIWGVPYLFIKVAVDGGISPLFLSWARIVLGASLLFALVPRPSIEMLRAGPRRWLVAYAVAEMVVPFPLISFGEEHVDSSVAAILIATVPLLIALLALRFDHTERPTRARLVGMLIGLVGVAALVGIDLSTDLNQLLGAAGILVAAFGYAVGPMLMKRHLVGYDPRAAMAASLAIAGVLLTPAGLLTIPGSVPDADVLASVIVLGIVCTAAAFVILMVLVAEIGAGRASVITYVNPVVAVALGVAILGESPGAGAIAGLLLILVVFHRLRRRWASSARAGRDRHAPAPPRSGRRNRAVTDPLDRQLPRLFLALLALRLRPLLLALLEGSGTSARRGRRRRQDVGLERQVGARLVDPGWSWR